MKFSKHLEYFLIFSRSLMEWKTLFVPGLGVCEDICPLHTYQDSGYCYHFFIKSWIKDFKIFFFVLIFIWLMLIKWHAWVWWPNMEGFPWNISAMFDFTMYLTLWIWKILIDWCLMQTFAILCHLGKEDWILKSLHWCRRSHRHIMMTIYLVVNLKKNSIYQCPCDCNLTYQII